MSDGLDFFISYNHRDERWAEWIAWQLENAGYSTRIQAWDFRPGSNFILEMQRATAEASKTIAVLSPNYLDSLYVQPEWAAAFGTDPTGADKKLIFVRVQQCEVEGLLAPLVQIRVENLDETTAISRLLEGVRGQRAKPKTAPTFPGSSKSLELQKPLYPGDLPKIWNVPFPINKYFTGRESLLTQLHKTLTGGTVAAITQPATVHGLGGIGKTQLVTQYAWLHRDEFDAVLWVNADGVSAVLSNFADLSNSTLLNLPEAVESKQEDRIRAVINWLRTNRRWLLVFDTVDSKESIDAIRKILAPGLQGSIAVTSRISDWPVGFDCLPVETLPETDSIEFVLRRTSNTNFILGSRDEAAEIVKKLG